MNFERAFEKLIDHEKGLSLDPKDRGNWTTGVIGKGELKGTKYGVSAMSYPHLDIRNLTLENPHGSLTAKGQWAGIDSRARKSPTTLLSPGLTAVTGSAVKVQT